MSPSSESVSNIGLRTPTPSVFVIPPEEEQADTPPWCCYDPEQAVDNDILDDIHTRHSLECGGQHISIRRYDPPPDITVVPRSRDALASWDADAHAAAAGAPDDDEDVVEMVRVPRRRLVQQEADEARQKTVGQTKSSKGFTLRSRATKVFKSMRNVTGAKSGSKTRKDLPDVPPSTENAQEPDTLRKKLSLDAQRPKSMHTDAPPPRKPFATFQASSTKPAPALTRRLSQLFGRPGRSQSDAARSPTADAPTSQPPPEFGQALSPSYSSDLGDLCTDDRGRPQTSLGLYRASENRALSAEPPLERRNSRRFSMTNLKSLFSAPLPREPEPVIQSPAVSASGLPTLPSSPASSDYGPFLGSGSPPPSLDAMPMVRSATAESEASTEAPETPTDAPTELYPEANTSEVSDVDGPYACVDEDGREARIRMSTAASAALGKGDAGVDESMEMRLDSLHFDSLRFDAGEFDLSV